MEVLLAIALIALCIFLSAYGGFQDTQTNTLTTARRSAAASALTFRCRSEMEKIDAIPEPIEVLVFELKNLFVQGDGSPCSFKVRMVDTTEGEDLSVLCAIDELQDPDSVSFLSTQSLPKILFGQVLNVESFTQVVSVPKEVLIFPRSGKRQITALLEVFQGGRVIDQASARFDLEARTEGYLDGLENRERSEEMGVYLAMHLAASDGTVDKSEAQIVKAWVRSLLGTDSVDSSAARKERLNSVLSDAYTKATSESLDLRFIAAELDRCASLPMKYDLIELCMDVMNADDVADPGEIRELKRIAKLIGLEEARYTALLDKRLAEVKSVEFDREDDLDSMLGISPDMSKEEIRKHLNREYRKWNARVSHDDKAIRQRAEQMIEKIAEARNRHL